MVDLGVEIVVPVGELATNFYKFHKGIQLRNSTLKKKNYEKEKKQLVILIVFFFFFNFS